MQIKKASIARILIAIVIILLSVPVALYIFNNPETEVLNDEARKGAGGSYVQLSQGITHYEMTGADTLETVVLVHGYSVPYYIWTALIMHWL